MERPHWYGSQWCFFKNQDVQQIGRQAWLSHDECKLLISPMSAPRVLPATDNEFLCSGQCTHCKFSLSKQASSAVHFLFAAIPLSVAEHRLCPLCNVCSEIKKIFNTNILSNTQSASLYLIICISYFYSFLVLNSYISLSLFPSIHKVSSFCISPYHPKNKIRFEIR